MSALSDGRRKIVVTDTIRTDSGQKANAVYDYNTGITYVANDADSGALRSFVTSHEYIHSIEGTKEYDKFANTIIKEIAENESYAAKYDIDRYAEAYRKAHPDVAEETLASIVRSEVVADFAAKEILTNEDAIKRLVKRDRGLISRVYEWVKDKIKTLVKSRNVDGAQDLEVIIRFDALYLASRADGALVGHYHNLGAEIIARLPHLISNPDAIVRMDNGRLNIFAEMSTAKGNNGIIAIELNTVKDVRSKME